LFFSQIFHTFVLGNLVNSQKHFETNLKLDTQVSILKQMGKNWFSCFSSSHKIEMIAQFGFYSVLMQSIPYKTLRQVRPLYYL